MVYPEDDWQSDLPYKAPEQLPPVQAGQGRTNEQLERDARGFAVLLVVLSSIAVWLVLARVVGWL
jgi:hypothetical protein